MPASELSVTVQGLKDGKGEVGCALFRGADGFPMDNRNAATQWHPLRAGNIECKFNQLPPGRYAVAVSVDSNGNRNTARNFVGMPKEPWGVSNNQRPRMRAPRFEEAAFKIKEGESARISIQVSK